MGELGDWALGSGLLGAASGTGMFGKQMKNLAPVFGVGGLIMGGMNSYNKGNGLFGFGGGDNPSATFYNNDAHTNVDNLYSDYSNKVDAYNSDNTLGEQAHNDAWNAYDKASNKMNGSVFNLGNGKGISGSNADGSWNMKDYSMAGQVGMMGAGMYTNYQQQGKDNKYRQDLANRSIASEDYTKQKTQEFGDGLNSWFKNRQNPSSIAQTSGVYNNRGY